MPQPTDFYDEVQGALMLHAHVKYKLKELYDLPITKITQLLSACNAPVDLRVMKKGCQR